MDKKEGDIGKLVDAVFEKLALISQDLAVLKEDVKHIREAVSKQNGRLSALESDRESDSVHTATYTERLDAHIKQEDEKISRISKLLDALSVKVYLAAGAATILSFLLPVVLRKIGG